MDRFSIIYQVNYKQGSHGQGKSRESSNNLWNTKISEVNISGNFIKVYFVA